MSTTSNPIRIAIIGAGAVSDYHHVPGIRIDPRAELVAACDMSTTPVPLARFLSAASAKSKPAETI